MCIHRNVIWFGYLAKIDLITLSHLLKFTSVIYLAKVKEEHKINTREQSD